MNRWVGILAWPLFGFLVLAGLLAAGLNHDPQAVHSPLIGRPAPDFSLPRLGGGEHFSPCAMRGKVWLLNVWATWCSACRQEHSVLLDMRRHRALTLVGLNYQEVRGDAGADMSTMTPAAEAALAATRATDWLQRHGDPYVLSALDLDGRVGMDYGVYGVPETYVIDRAGVIRFRHAGPLTAAVLANRILPLVEALSR